jgi:hypothetical protein
MLEINFKFENALGFNLPKMIKTNKNTPLQTAVTSCRLLIDLLTELPITIDSQKFQSLNKHSEKLTALIEQVLELNKIGRLDLTPSMIRRGVKDIVENESLEVEEMKGILLFVLNDLEQEVKEIDGIARSKGKLKRDFSEERVVASDRRKTHIVAGRSKMLDGTSMEDILRSATNERLDNSGWNLVETLRPIPTDATHLEDARTTELGVPLLQSIGKVLNIPEGALKSQTVYKRTLDPKPAQKNLQILSEQQTKILTNINILNQKHKEIDVKKDVLKTMIPKSYLVQRKKVQTIPELEKVVLKSCLKKSYSITVMDDDENSPNERSGVFGSMVDDYKKQIDDILTAPNDIRFQCELGSSNNSISDSVNITNDIALEQTYRDFKENELDQTFTSFDLQHSEFDLQCSEYPGLGNLNSNLAELDRVYVNSLEDENFELKILNGAKIVDVLLKYGGKTVKRMFNLDDSMNDLEEMIMKEYMAKVDTLYLQYSLESHPFLLEDIKDLKTGCLVIINHQESHTLEQVQTKINQLFDMVERLTLFHHTQTVEIVPPVKTAPKNELIKFIKDKKDVESKINDYAHLLENTRKDLTRYTNPSKSLKKVLLQRNNEIKTMLASLNKFLSKHIEEDLHEFHEIEVFRAELNVLDEKMSDEQLLNNIIKVLDFQYSTPRKTTPIQMNIYDLGYTHRDLMDEILSKSVDSVDANDIVEINKRNRVGSPDLFLEQIQNKVIGDGYVEVEEMRKKKDEEFLKSLFNLKN